MGNSSHNRTSAERDMDDFSNCSSGRSSVHQRNAYELLPLSEHEHESECSENECEEAETVEEHAIKDVVTEEGGIQEDDTYSLHDADLEEPTIKCTRYR